MKVKQFTLIVGLVMLCVFSFAQHRLDFRATKAQTIKNSFENELSIGEAPIENANFNQEVVNLQLILSKFGADSAFVGNSTDEIYQSLKLADGSLTEISAFNKDPYPMADEFANGKIYRLLVSKQLLEVNPEDGTTSELGVITGVTGTMTGLAYNWLDSTMYVVGFDGDDATFFLASVDLETFEATKVGTGVDGIPIIAADFAEDGYLYGPALSDKLYRIDPANGEITMIGAIGLNINYGQDVSFDYNTKKLYTSTAGAATKFGTYNLNTGEFEAIATIGKQMATFATITAAADSAAPNMPTEFVLTPNINGENNAELSWINPAISTTGEELEELTSVLIYSSADDFNEPIDTIENPVIGEAATYTANVENPGFYTFRIVGKNSNGTGYPVFATAYIGEDLPAAPTNLSVTVDEMDVDLIWNAPTEGINGAYFSGNDLTYDVLRFPGAVLVADDISDTTFSETIENNGEYYYKVIASNLVGTGGQDRSDYFIVGNAVVVEHFNVPGLPNGWTVKGDSLGNWKISNTGWAGGSPRELYFDKAPSFTGSSFFTSPVANTTGFEAIDLSFATRIIDQSGSAEYTLGVFTTSDGGNTWDTVWKTNPTVSTAAENINLKITNDDVGSENFQLAFGFIGLSDDIKYWFIDNIDAFEGTIPNFDAKAISVAPSGMFNAGIDTVPSTVIYNNGTDAIDSCIVSITINDGNENVYEEIDTIYSTIQSGDSLVVEMDEAWSVVEGTYDIVAVVNVLDDLDPDNDTVTSEIIAIPENDIIAFASIWNSDDEIMINGKFHLGSNQFLPLGNSDMIRGAAWKNDEWYAITAAGEFGTVNPEDGTFTSIGETGCEGNYITSLAYNPITEVFYTLTLSGSYPNFTIGLWAIDHNTGQGIKIADSDHAGSAFVIAFDDAGHLYVVEHQQNANGKLYEMDENTAAMTEIGDLGGQVSPSFQSMSWDYETAKCYFQATGSAGQMSGTYEVNVETGTATLIGDPLGQQVMGLAIPNNFEPQEYTATFNVTDSDGGAAIEGATVLVNNETLTTDANGAVTIELFNGDYPYTVSFEGYESVNGNLTVYGAATEENVALDLSAVAYTVSFNIVDKEGGAALEGANIEINGENLTTDVNGAASIDLNDGNYEYTVSLDNYIAVSGDVTVDGENIDVYLEMEDNGVSEIGKAAIRIYPNPSSGVFNVELDGSNEITVLNITGELVYKAVIVNKGVVNLENQAEGVYFLQIKSNERISSYKLVVRN